MILIMGASGTVGGATAAALGGRRDVLLATRRLGPLPSGERWLDLERPEGFGPALAGVTSLFLMLPPGLRDARARVRALLAEARARDVRRAAFLSIRNADRLPMLPHRGIERELERSGLGWTHLRPNDFMQNFAAVAVYRDAIRAGRLVGPGGESRTSYVDVRDVGAAAAAVLTEDGHEGRAYPLTGPASLTLRHVAASISRALGRPVEAETPSLPHFFCHARRMGAPVPLALVMTSIGLVARLGLADGVDPELPALIGRPTSDFGAFARDHADEWATCADSRA